MSEILELAREISDYTICGEGNVSMRKSENTFVIKASGTSLHTLSDDDLTLCNVRGVQIELLKKKPSIETSFHAWIMRTFPDINFIAHTHPPNTTKILCSNQLYQFANRRWFPDQIVRNGTKSCVVPYAPPGEAILTASASKKDCAAATLMCEKSADIFIGAKLLGEVNFLTRKEVADVDTCPNENYRRNMYQ